MENYSPNVCAYWVVPHAGTWIEISIIVAPYNKDDVVPHAGTWIEIYITKYITKDCVVVPHAGTWIEIVLGSVGSE